MKTLTACLMTMTLCGPAIAEIDPLVGDPDLDPTCAMYLCVGGGPSAMAHPICQAARVEMAKRTIAFKSPIVPFSQCTTDGKNDDGISISFGIAALLGQYTNWSGNVVKPDIPILNGVPCQLEKNPVTPEGCITTLQSITVTQNGKQLEGSNTYYIGKDIQSHYIQDPVTLEVTRLTDMD